MKGDIVQEYSLYLESGPRKKKTMVHVLDLLGCIAQGATTDEALEATPDAIREFIRFLHMHADYWTTDEPFTTQVCEHVMEGPWLGNGDPAPGFRPDFGPLTSAELTALLRRLSWMQEDFLKWVGEPSRDVLAAHPEGRGRALAEIVLHVGETHADYLRMLTGPVDGLADAVRTLRASEGLAPNALTGVWQVVRGRMERLTEIERRRLVPHGQVTWSARRALRRMLEHQWEHLVEVTARLTE